MTLNKENIAARFNYCCAIADDIVKNGLNFEMISHAKRFAEIESPITDDTEGRVRICFADIYIYIYLNENDCFSGECRYQLDPFGWCGGEIIDVSAKEDFGAELNNLEINSDLVKGWYEDFGDILPKKYAEFRKNDAQVF